jgi:prepilin-type N-terminal cleavage/methylation domain-containing protein
MTRGSHRRPDRAAGFTLIEMVIVVLVILILLGLTMAVVGKTINGDRVRGAARQVQAYLAGARDRAIYAASRIESDDEIPPSIGVRFLPDPAFVTPDDPATPNVNEFQVRAFSSMVFVQEVDPLPTFLTVFRDQNTGVWSGSQFSDDGQGNLRSFGLSGGEFALRAAGSLMQRGLLPGRLEGTPPVPTYYLPVYFDRDSSREPYYLRFVQTDLRRDNPGGQPVQAPAFPNPLPSGFTWWLYQGQLSKPYFDATSTSYVPQPCRFRVLPSVMPSEEPRLLPRGSVVDVQSSRIGGASLAGSLRVDGSFDVMFNARGVVDGPTAAAGQIHLVVADGDEVERGFRIVSPFVDVDGTPGPDDSDGDGNFDERQGEEFIVSVRTQTGSIYVSNVDPTLQTAAPTLRANPFNYANGGGEAR